MSSPFKNFIIGSSYPIVLPFFYIVGHKLVGEQDKNYKLSEYVLIAPLYLGLMNVIRNYYSLSLPQISILSALIVSTFARYTDSYNFSEKREWVEYTVSLLIQHSIAYYVMSQISKYIK